MRNYRTIQGDTWDVIAFREYNSLGGEKLMHLLIDANPQYKDYVYFPAGIILIVPDVEIPRSNTLPPWVD